jgi:hypothetical protein
VRIRQRSLHVKEEYLMSERVRERLQSDQDLGLQSNHDLGLRARGRLDMELKNLQRFQMTTMI